MHDLDLVIFLAMRRIIERRLANGTDGLSYDEWDDLMMALPSLDKLASLVLNEADFDYYTRGY